MIKIAVDCMGGDNGSEIVVSAIKTFKQNNPSISIAAVGKKEELKDLENIAEIIDAREVIPMDAGALQVMRMKDSSMNKALKLMKDEHYDAVVSCGSTGGFLSASTLILKLIPGVKRAALVTPFPTKIKGKKVTLLDIGANNENSSDELVQFAKMGRLYSQAVFGIKEPKVYLLSNGAEEEKGAPEVKEAHKLLKEMNFPNFEGNIEARYVLDGNADVVVSDGYTGNIFLKGTEGAAKFLGGMIKKAFKKNLWTKLGYLHVKKGIDEINETMNYKSAGGAMLLGVNGVVVKGHGNSDAYAFSCALEVAKKLAMINIVNAIKEGMTEDE